MNRATIVFAILLIVAFPLSLLAGRLWIDPASTPNATLILMELRLPRAVLAIAIGAGLGIGALWCIGGIVVTAVTLSAASGEEPTLSLGAPSSSAPFSFFAG